MSYLWLVIFLILIYKLSKYYWYRRDLYALAIRFDGPISLPVIGCTLPFLFHKTEDFLQVFQEIINKHDKTFRFWLGPKLLIVFQKPEHVEKILCSSKFQTKHDIYDTMKIFLGEGLVTSSGPIYKQNKKILAPNFNLQFCNDIIPLIEKHTNICINNLRKEADFFDIGPNIYNLLVDIVGKAVLGYNFKAQSGGYLKYVKEFTDVYEISFARIVKPWLHPRFLFDLSSDGKRMKKMCQLANNLMSKVIENSYQRLDFGNPQDSFPMVDKILKQVQENPNSPLLNDLPHHLLTLYMASQDTIALAVSAACFCLGMYPECQRKLYEEIQAVPEDITSDILSELKYLDMCIKETLRIFPIGPYIIRKTTEDQFFDQYFLPKNCGILIPIFNLHRDDEYWENPYHFYPDHFLPEKEKHRPAFCYVPFSAGVRGCIGKVLAGVATKVVLIKLLKTFEITSLGQLPDVKLTMDISIRAQNGYQVKLKQRLT